MTPLTYEPAVASFGLSRISQGRVTLGQCGAGPERTGLISEKEKAVRPQQGSRPNRLRIDAKPPASLLPSTMRGGSKCLVLHSHGTGTVKPID